MLSAVHVRGLRELDAAFALASKAEQRELRVGLAEAAEPIARHAENRSRETIRNIGDAWSEMRVGVTSRLVYVAPKRRGARNALLKRPNLGELLMGRAMLPALEDGRAEVVERVGHVLDHVGHVWEAV